MISTTRSVADELLRDPACGSAALWDRLRREAEEALARDSALAPFLARAILDRRSFEDAVIHRLASRLGSTSMPAFQIEDIFRQAVLADPMIGEAFLADLAMVRERDPTCERLIEPLLYFKGYHAIETHRIAHRLWMRGRPEIAFHLQSRASEVFQADIHPGARFGKGIFLDHATGLVVGATTVVEDDVSILQNVTLGGTGKEVGDRHPKVRRGVRIGAGAKVLGNIEIGAGACIAVGSVVLRPVPAGATVAGVPARIIGSDRAQPKHGAAQAMIRPAYEAFAYTI